MFELFKKKTKINTKLYSICNTCYHKHDCNMAVIAAQKKDRRYRTSCYKYSKCTCENCLHGKEEYKKIGFFDQYIGRRCEFSNALVDNQNTCGHHTI